jgi:hypothetical protein
MDELSTLFRQSLHAYLRQPLALVAVLKSGMKGWGADIDIRLGLRA